MFHKTLLGMIHTSRHLRQGTLHMNLERSSMNCLELGDESRLAVRSAAALVGIRGIFLSFNILDIALHVCIISRSFLLDIFITDDVPVVV